MRSLGHVGAAGAPAVLLMLFVCQQLHKAGARCVRPSSQCSGLPPPPSPDNLAFCAPCCSNFITDRPSSRVLAPPGGVTSWSLGGDIAPPAPKPRPAAGVSGVEWSGVRPNGCTAASW